MPEFVISVANNAGSAGKSTTTVNLAAELGARGRKVVVMDFDAQGNATQGLGHDPAEVKWCSTDVLLRRCSMADALLDTVADGVRLLPGSPNIDPDLVELETVQMRDTRLQMVLRDLPEDVDTVIIDCAGSLNRLTINALMAATSVVTVAFPTSKELGGVPKIESVIAEIAELTGSGVALGAVVPCAVPPEQAGALYRDGVQMLRDSYEDLVTPSVRRTVIVSEALDRGLPLSMYDPDAAVTADYRAVLEHLLKAGVL